MSPFIKYPTRLGGGSPPVTPSRHLVGWSIFYPGYQTLFFLESLVSRVDCLSLDAVILCLHEKRLHPIRIK